MEGSCCPSCFNEITNVNRLITEICGHSKCRDCFILEENVCAQCSKSNLEAKVIENILISPTLRKQVPTDKKTIKNHIITVGDQYKCIICDKEFRSRQQQYYHLHCDEPEEARPYKCSQCPRGFLKESHLKYHLKTHLLQKISCKVCEKEFSNKITLNKHLKKHKQRKKYKCDICSAEYRDEISFKFHLTSHSETSNSKPILCNICGKRFFIKSQLRRHAVIHKRDRIKLFGCGVCNSKFFRASSLKDHVQKHESLAKFECDICHKYFTEEKALRRHIVLHDTTNVYQCEVCEAKLNRKDNLIRHVKNMHPGYKPEAGLNLVIRENRSNPSETLTSNEIIRDMEENHSEDIHVEVSHKKIETMPFQRNYDDITTVNCTSTGPINKKYIQCPVIKSVGNAKPLDVILSPRTTDKNLPKITLSINPINIPALANKKLKKKYDPAEIYRKILFVNNDEGQTPTSSKDNAQETDDKSNPNNKNTATNSNDDTTCSYSNFIEKHWRKNFYS